jgi:hypothetical protein
MRAIISSPRILRTGAPLSLAAIEQHCPAVFAREAHSSRGPRYQYVPTVVPLEALMENGWGVYEAAQQRSRKADKDPYTKHMLRLRKLADFEDTDMTRDGVPEVVLINAHDGTAAYHLRGGYFKYICTNGLMVGTTLAGFKVRHTVGVQTSKEVLEAGEKVVVETFPKMLESISRFRETPVNAEQKMRLAEKALTLRFGSYLPKFPATDLLHVRRDEDRKDTLWNMLNVIQENVLNGGWETTSLGYGRRSEVRAIERVTSIASINGGLWDEAEAIARETA